MVLEGWIGVVFGGEMRGMARGWKVTIYCRFWGLGLQLGLQTGVTFWKNWGYKSGEKWGLKADGGKHTILQLYLGETYPFEIWIFLRLHLIIYSI